MRWPAHNPSCIPTPRPQALRTRQSRDRFQEDRTQQALLGGPAGNARRGRRCIGFRTCCRRMARASGARAARYLRRSRSWRRHPSRISAAAIRHASPAWIAGTFCATCWTERMGDPRKATALRHDEHPTPRGRCAHESRIRGPASRHPLTIAATPSSPPVGGSARPSRMSKRTFWVLLDPRCAVPRAAAGQSALAIQGRHLAFQIAMG